MMYDENATCEEAIGTTLFGSFARSCAKHRLVPVALAAHEEALNGKRGRVVIIIPSGVEWTEVVGNIEEAIAEMRAGTAELKKGG